MISLDPLLELMRPAPAGFTLVWFRDVAGAAEFAQIRADALPKPGCWFVRAAEKSRHLGERAEELTINFDVVIVIENAREHKSRADTDNQLLAYRKEVRHRLLGWEIELEPGERVKPIKFAGGKALEYRDGEVFWADRYEFQATITNYLPDPAPYEKLSYQEEPLS